MAGLHNSSWRFSDERGAGRYREVGGWRYGENGHWNYCEHGGWR
jgi:hypothetical protein